MPAAENRSLVVLLTALVAFGPLSTDLYLPALPTLVRVFGTDSATVQLTLSVFLAGFAVSQLVYGQLSDRFGRRPMILAGIAIFVVASVACTLAQTIEQLVVARFFQAVGACCGPVLGRAVVRDVYGPDGAARVLAYMALAMALAPTIGLVLGGVLTEAFGWRVNFAMLTGFGIVMLVAVAARLGETNLYRDPEALRLGRLAANYAALLRHRAYVGYLLCVAFTYAGIFAFISGSSFVLIDLVGLTPTAYGLCFGAIVVGYMIGSFAAGRLTHRLGVDRMIALGTTVGVAGGAAGVVLALAMPAGVASVVGPVFVFLVGAGLTLPNAMAGVVGPFPRMAGIASAFVGFAQMVLAAGVGIAIGLFDDGTELAMMAAIGVVACGAWIAFGLLVRTRPGMAEEPAAAD